jgi:3-hydroxyisobutyrate dehydrogenase
VKKMSGSGRFTVGSIGLGAMGGRMAANLQKAGFALIVNDINRSAAEPLLAKGAEWADSPAALAARSDVIFSCLPGPDQVRSVALGSNGVITSIRNGAAFFEMSTISVDLAREVSEEFAAKGASMLDAPISGGVAAASSGTLAIWVGGEKSVFEEFLPVLTAIGRPIHVGPVGTGLVTKLVHNCASQTMQMALAEIFAMGVKSGAEPLALWEALRMGGAGGRRTFDCLADEYLTAAFEGGNAPVRLSYKDMVLATDLARKLKVPMRFADLALADITEGMNRHWADLDQRLPMTLAQDRIGIRIKVPVEGIDAVFRRDPAAPTDPKHGKRS